MANGQAIGVAYRDQDIVGADYLYSANELGYTAAASGSVTQATSKSTGVTLNTSCGTITMNNAALAASTTVVFTLTNSKVSAQDAVIVNVVSGPATDGTYQAFVAGISAGSAKIALRNISAGSLSEAVVLNYVIVHGGA